MSYSLTDLTSVLRFIQDNRQLGRLGDQSFDALAGNILDLFDFNSAQRTDPLLLDQTSGEFLK